MWLSCVDHVVALNIFIFKLIIEINFTDIICSIIVMQIKTMYAWDFIIKHKVLLVKSQMVKNIGVLVRFIKIN